MVENYEFPRSFRLDIKFSTMERKPQAICQICIHHPMRILLLDNYDSFTWNLQHYLVRAGAQVDVHRNDAIQPMATTGYDGIVLSPGPGLPAEAGQLMNLITVAAAQRIPVLGVCLGMQAIAESFGAMLRNLPEVLHGQQTALTTFEPEGLFAGVTRPTPIGHYHSWVVDEEDWPAVLQVTARNESGLPMALRHSTLPIVGIQFHPESVLTPEGDRMLRNWLESVAAYRKQHPPVPSLTPVWGGPEGTKPGPQDAARAPGT